MSLPVLELQKIEKVYPGVKPLDQVDFQVLPGEVHALLGENGAGKSTLTKVIGGSTRPNGGSITYLGETVTWRSPRQARDAGIHIIHQELALFPELTVAENILIDHQPRGALGLISQRTRMRRAREVLDMLGVDIDPAARVDDLPLADQQMVEIAKALVGDLRLLILDEPTAVISGREVDLLFDRMRHLRAQGIGIVYISHRLEEIFEIADRVTVLKDGQVVGTRPVAELSRDQMISMMVGREITGIYPPKAARPPVGDPVLRIRGLASGQRVRDVSIELRAGEIVGMAGMVGSGRTEVADAVFGVGPVDGGEILLDGQPLGNHSPAESIARGIGYLTENRKGQGLFLSMPVSLNVVAPALKDVSAGPMIDAARERDIAKEQVAAFSVATPSVKTPVGALSGGNQQKVLFSRWTRISDRLLILDEPTRGVDVGAKVEIYRIIRELADKGLAILMISSELPEVVGLSDRVVVMANGVVTGEVTGDDINEDSIMKYAVASHGVTTATREVLS
ncbi:sugar ABC transporter ATP-binding protein [Roseovarius atlanticus]|uniref:sugar ABC transporter ATP-binding protein n=1 Tax=Roseovarius atlanticus TaxID=1641875 RepID=UPI001C93D39A|nr:sugar ABC transporter ATP-binding protein [Roseovarius atlanticus]MBY5990014.1 sugar ABC transporter ATP-binding protein [Roseovarius atlanticus]MBY6126559.1 sugar ABC transporter ATP-binding protein [Roseovarius atlanticus]MBY6151053.1 sugar ABC transporter ATP-binding protein [Roseovarius atlanticus]